MSGDPAASANHYEILGVPPNAQPAEIKQAYRAALLRLHPDKSTEGNGADPTAPEFLALQQAWEVMKDAASRRDYDQKLADMALQKELAISEHVDLDDMEWSEVDGKAAFRYTCRCGGSYILDESELIDQSDHVMVQCNFCSLCIQVYYSIA